MSLSNIIVVSFCSFVVSRLYSCGTHRDIDHNSLQVRKDILLQHLYQQSITVCFVRREKNLIRYHESRGSYNLFKIFKIISINCIRYDNIDSLSYLHGHLDPSHIEASSD